MRSGLLVVTSREPYTHYHDALGAIHCRVPPGGVHRALDSILSQHKGAWVAWGNGSADEEAVDANDVVMVPPESPKYPLRRIWLSKREVENFYHGFSNQVLWPFLHSMPSKVHFRRRFWEGYRKVSRRFALAIDEEKHRYKNTLIWIHDYQLSLVPSYIRAANPRARMAHFWHVPWPGRDIYRTLPQGAAILSSLLSCDWIGFHLEEYVENFLRCVELGLDAKVNRAKGWVQWNGRKTLVRAFPISVDFERFQLLAGNSAFKKKLVALRRRFGIKSEDYGIGVERMDYSKGILERLDGIRIFFRKHPEFQERFSFLQIATPSREGVPSYLEHRDRVYREVKRINQLYGTRSWKPVSLIEKNVAQNDLAFLYRGAQIALVTSLRDGMNLVAKEFIASQLDQQGVLILSRFAGASKEMKEALLVNPFDVEGITAALSRAVRMKPQERRSRLIAMQGRLKKNNVHAWAESVLADINKTCSKRKP